MKELLTLVETIEKWSKSFTTNFNLKMDIIDTKLAILENRMGAIDHLCCFCSSKLDPDTNYCPTCKDYDGKKE